METFSALLAIYALCGEFTGHRWIPHTKASDAELWCFLWSALDKRLSKQWRGGWFETPSRPIYRHYNALGFFFRWATLNGWFPIWTLHNSLVSLVSLSFIVIGIMLILNLVVITSFLINHIPWYKIDAVEPRESCVSNLRCCAYKLL